MTPPAAANFNELRRAFFVSPRQPYARPRSRTANANPAKREKRRRTPAPRYFFFSSAAGGLGGLIMMCARCVPGSMIHGPPGLTGLSGMPVVSGVA